MNFNFDQVEFSSKEKRKIKSLMRRAEHLERRISDSRDKELSYDKQELAALIWVMDQIGIDCEPNKIAQIIAKNESEYV